MIEKIKLINLIFQCLEQERLFASKVWKLALSLCVFASLRSKKRSWDTVQQDQYFMMQY